MYWNLADHYRVRPVSLELLGLAGLVLVLHCCQVRLVCLVLLDQAGHLVLVELV
jgi:hypothetical protein